MKKIICVLMVLFLFSLPALAETDKTEITFCVGDSTLTINGEEVTVEKPYVVGAGVTLVPARVITEAFGATVEWEAETKTVTINYSDIYIVLQIDNPIALVNDETKELLSAPELTSNGYTMIPLRFISENFGATVGYDEETKRISVVKENSKQTWSLTPNADGLIVCSSELYNFSITVPAGYEGYKQSENEVLIKSLAENDFSLVSVGIYSKDKVTGATALAREILAENKDKYNKSAVSTDADITKTTFRNFAGCEVGSTIKAASLKAEGYCLYFESGDYVYNINILDDHSANNQKTYREDILNSIVLSEIDFSVVGSLDRVNAEVLSAFQLDEITRCSISLPGEFSGQENEIFLLKSKDDLKSDEKCVYSNGEIVFEARRMVFDLSDVKNLPYNPEGLLTLADFQRLFSYSGGFRTDINTEIKQAAKKVKIGENELLKMVLVEEKDKYICYHEIYIGELKDALYVFSASYPEIHYSVDNKAKVMSIMSTLKFEK